MNKLIAIVAACFMLVACDLIPKPPLDLSTPQVTITKAQFECGPAAPPLPSEAELLEWSSRRLLDEYKVAWNWGFRCDTLLKENQTYFEQSIKDRDALKKKNK